MDPRTKTILEYYIAAGGSQKLWFTWYNNDDEKVTTQFYFGPMSKVKIPKKIKGQEVTELDCTTFCGQEHIESVTIPNIVTTIY